MNQWPPLTGTGTHASGSGAPANGPHSDAVHAIPFVRDDATGKSLHFSLDELQSRMNLHDATLLEVDYTRTMMGFLLFNRSPASIAMVGLGGGSLAKFCHRYLPGSRMRVAEINPHVIALRHDFEVPADDSRFEVVEADGAVFVAARRAAFDVLLIDGFDLHGQPAALCSQAFYDACHAALKPDGVLVVNLHYDDAGYPLLLARLQRSFGGNAVDVPALEKSNAIVFASRGKTISPRSFNLQASLAGLKPEARRQLKAEFGRIAWHVREPAEDPDGFQGATK